MLYNDQPIGQDEEDKLNRTPFVDEIVELIDRYTEADEKKDNHDGLVIGLEGAWGSGKTSVLIYWKIDSRRKRGNMWFNDWTAGWRWTLLL